ncbi:MAG: transcription termination factor NusA [Planctomycetes bacterium]|nr:transcription termination factor NusA [Planctomycetota bacterium]
MSSEILRYIDSIARDKEIDADSLIAAIETAVAQAVARKYGIDDLVMQLDRTSGEWISNYEIDLEREGRILAQTVKQTILGRVREAERDVLYDEFEQKLGEIVIGTVRRVEGEAVFVELGRNMEGILPRAERVRSENYNVGDRIKAMVLDVKKAGNRVKVILSRAHRDFVRALFELEVPEIADGVINIRRIEREPGYRTKLAVDSTDDKVDCVGACVGVRGTRIKSIIDELNGERIDIIRWYADAEQLILNGLKPAEVAHIELDPESRRALVLVDEDQLSLAIGRRGQNVRLASKLTGWDIDIMTRAELEKSIADEDDGEPGTRRASEVQPGEGGDATATPDTDSAAGGPDATIPGAGVDAPDAGTEDLSPGPGSAPGPDGSTTSVAESSATEPEPDPEPDPAAEPPGPAPGEPERQT